MLITGSVGRKGRNDEIKVEDGREKWQKDVEEGNRKKEGKKGVKEGSK